MSKELKDERQVRIDKLQQIQSKGINPYPARVKRTHQAQGVLDNFEKLQSDQESVSVAGRIRLLRRHGGSTFMRVEDESGLVQLFFSKKIVGEEQYELVKLLDMGDFVSATGKVFLTKTEEKTIQVDEFQIVNKAINPLPEKFHGLKDDEARARQRYLDLIANPDVKELFKKRSAFVKSMREFLQSAGFMEVETPVLEHVPGGAEAEPFITHHNTLDIDLYLRISLELHLKRLVVGGYEKIFEIGKVFRNEGMSTQHLQEFTMMEMYWAYADNEKLMGFVQSMYQKVIEDTVGTLKIGKLDFSGDWPRLDYRDLFKKHAGIDLKKIKTADELKAAVKKKKINIKIEEGSGLGRIIDQVYKKTVRPKIVQPSFLINHPVEISPLSKRHEDDPRIVERHQVIINGAEVGNGFSELNDPIDQRNRFEDQLKLREAGDKEAYMLDEDFLTAIDHGMPPTAGFGVGIDRLFMIITEQESIRDIVFFPTMKPKV